MIYLDTHAVVWLYQKNIDFFTENGITYIENETLAVSPIVLLELEYLFEINRISEHGVKIIDYLHDHIDIRICKHQFSQVVGKALGLQWTRDPFDRIINAQAMVNTDILLTKDPVIQKYYDKAIW